MLCGETQHSMDVQKTGMAGYRKVFFFTSLKIIKLSQNSLLELRRLFCRPDLGEVPEGIEKVLMHDCGGVEAEQLEGQLYAKAYNDSSQDGAYAKGPSQQRAYDDHNDLKAASAGSYRELGLPGQHHHQAVARSCPKAGGYVVDGGYGNDKQPDHHLNQTKVEVGELGKDIQSKQEVHEQADEDHVAQGAQTEFFSRHHGDDTENQPYKDGDGPYLDTKDSGESCMEDLPRCIADVGLHGKYNSYCIEKQSEK